MISPEWKTKSLLSINAQSPTPQTRLTRHTFVIATRMSTKTAKNHHACFLLFLSLAPYYRAPIMNVINI